jgi:hypothetical protein
MSTLFTTISAKACVLALIIGLVCGCRLWPQKRPASADVGQQPISNPLPVPMYDRSLVMDEISDELDNYFRIQKEERIRIVDGVMTEGWIETHPTIGGSLAEPWRRDSSPGFEKLHATLQTVRRFAKVRVIPGAGNYLVDVKVYKELEDLPSPLHSTMQSRPYRHDNTLDIDQMQLPDVQPNLGWIPLGRDLALEERILQNVQARFAQIKTEGNASAPH